LIKGDTMDEIIRWGIPVIVAILSLFIGREWQKHDLKRAEDKKTFEKLLSLLPPGTGSIPYIRKEDFGNAFFVDSLQDVFNISDNLCNPELEFINKNLEKRRKLLFSKIDLFSSKLGDCSRPIGSGKIRMNRIFPPKDPEDATDDEWQEFEQNRKYFNDLSTEICSLYDELILEGKKL
jgi:hypothetical protein